MIDNKTAKIVTNQHGERVIRIEFPYSLEMIEKVRTLPGRQYHHEERVWSAPIYEGALNDLIKWGFQLDDKLNELIRKTKLLKDEIVTGDLVQVKGELYPFQKEGISWIESRGGRALIADEMGLGKTIQAIGWLSMHPELRPVIIVVPASLKLNWANEITKWTGEKSIEVLSGTKGHKLKSRINIINYDIVHGWLNHLRGCLPKVLIIDEIHYIKTNSAKRTKAVKMFGKNIPCIIGLSGTPIINRPIEAFNALKIINEELFPDYWKFAERYCNLKHNGFGWDMTGHSREEELHHKLTSTVMIRRLKKDVLKELPDKIYSFVPMELSNKTEYQKAENDFIRFVMDTKGREAARKAANAEAFTKIEGLKQLSAKGKLKQCIKWINDFLESDNKLVVFATHHFVIDELMKEFSKIAVKIDGSVSQTMRQEAVDRFQTDPKIKLFIGNIKAAGVGITLTASSNVAFIELPWTPGELSQAIDRCHRITQKFTVNVYYLLTSGTIEEKTAKLLDVKKMTVDHVLNGEVPKDEALLYQLMKEYE